MTLSELQNVLGDEINSIIDKSLTSEQRKEEYLKADAIARLAKQMINNADIAIRADRMLADGRSITNLRKML